MRRRWALWYDISRGTTYLLPVHCRGLLTVQSAALPDYVFDEGERQPRSAQKRPKTAKVCIVVCPAAIAVPHNMDAREQGLRQVRQYITRCPTQEATVGCLVSPSYCPSTALRCIFRSSHSTSTPVAPMLSQTASVPSPTLAKALTNGTQHGLNNPSADDSQPQPSVYTSSIKDPAQLNPPFGENIAVPTSVNAS